MQELRARITMRLEYADEALRLRFFRGFERRGDFRRMMCVVVNDPDILDMGLRLETAFCTVERGQSRRGFFERHAD